MSKQRRAAVHHPGYPRRDLRRVLQQPGTCYQARVFWNGGELFIPSTGRIGLFENEGVLTYKSTLENLFYCYCSSDGIGFGSDPYFGLYIDETLTKGSTHGCKTFGNQPLASRLHFTIKRIEIFSFNYNTN